MTKIIISILLAPITMIWSGFVLSVLWGWFVVPLGVAAISIPIAIGITMIVHYLTYQFDAAVTEKREWAEQVAFALMKPTMALFFGWIVSLFL